MVRGVPEIWVALRLVALRGKVPLNMQSQASRSLHAAGQAEAASKVTSMLCVNSSEWL